MHYYKLSVSSKHFLIYAKLTNFMTKHNFLTFLGEKLKLN